MRRLLFVVGETTTVFTNTDNNVHTSLRSRRKIKNRKTEPEMQSHQNMAISAANRHNAHYYFIPFLAVTLIQLCTTLFIYSLSSQFHSQQDNDTSCAHALALCMHYANKTKTPMCVCEIGSVCARMILCLSNFGIILQLITAIVS